MLNVNMIECKHVHDCVFKRRVKLYDRVYSHTLSENLYDSTKMVKSESKYVKSKKIRKPRCNVYRKNHFNECRMLKFTKNVTSDKKNCEI